MHLLNFRVFIGSLALVGLLHAQSTGSGPGTTSPAAPNSPATAPRATPATSTAPSARATTPNAPSAVTTPVTPPPVAADPTRLTRPAGEPVAPPLTPPRTPAAAVRPLSAPANAARSVSGQAPGAAFQVVPPATSTDAASLAAAGLDVALDPVNTVEAVRGTDRSRATETLGQVRNRIDAASRALEDLRARARAGGLATAGSNFDQAAADLATREQLLRDALRDAGSATSDEAWRQAQSQITTLYQSYAAAVRRAETLVTPPPPR